MLPRLSNVRRRTLAALLCVAALTGTGSPATADQFDSFLDSINAYSPDDPLGTPLGDPIPDSVDIDPAARQGMIEELEKDSPGNEPDLSEEGQGESEGEGERDGEDDGDADITKLSEKIDALEDEMSDLEKSLDEVEELAGNPGIVVSGTSKSTMKITGRIHLDAWGFDTDDDPAINQFSDGPGDPVNRLGFRRIRFALQGKIKDNMIYKLEVELADAPDAEFRDMFIGWVDLPVFQEVLLGNQKRPFGLDHLNSSRHNVFIERPFFVEAFNEDARRLGLQSYGVSEDLSYNWQYGVFNQRNIQDESNYLGDHLQLQLAGRLANTFWYDQTSNGRGYAHWAISGTHADVSENADDGSLARFRTRPEARTEARWLDTGTIDGAEYYNLMGFESVVNLGSLQLVGEYQSNWVEREGFQDVRFDGGYVYASYFLTGEHIPWDRSSGTIDRVVPLQNFWIVNTKGGGQAAGWGAWQVAARYSQSSFTDEDIFGGVGEALTIGMNWYWNANARMQFNYITGKIDESTVGDRLSPPVGGDYDIYGARFAVDF